MFSRYPFTFAVLLFMSLVVSAATPTQLSTSEPDITQPLAGLEGFVDGLMSAHLQREGIPGAVISVVHNNRTILSKGYGFADLENQKRVNADKTLFRIGSVSKLFTWTAVMQLYQRGMIDLDKNINDYLADISVPDGGSNPITMRHLMSHTPGFEDGALGFLIFNDPEHLITQKAFIQRYMHYHKRVHEPGTTPSYSNFGVALAGQIVEQVSGMPFDDYVEKNIFEPLQMHQTTFRESLGGEQDNNVSKGYVKKNGVNYAQDFEYLHHLGPAGSVSATASEMAHFMMTHLNGGVFYGSRILSEKTNRLMHSTLYKVDQRLNGMAYGFMQGESNGYKTLMHGGGTLWFSSLLVLVPEKNLGVFVSFNSVDKHKIRTGIVDSIVKRYFGSADSNNMIGLGAVSPDLNQFSGYYRNTRRSYHRLEKISEIGKDLIVKPYGKNHLLLIMGDDESQWRYLSKGLFEQKNTGKKLLFQQNGNDDYTKLFVSEIGMVMSFQKLKFFEQSRYHFLLCLLSAVIFLLLFVRLVRHREVDVCSRSVLVSKMVVLVMVIAWIIYLLAFAMALYSLGSSDNSIVFKYPTKPIQYWATTAMITLPISLLALPAAYVFWRDTGKTISTGLPLVVTLIMVVMMMLTLNDWNIFGYRY
jgi:CubicO group peptidase (beta-lactamase class C family)